MRSNIARTCFSGSVPVAAPPTASSPLSLTALSKRSEELNEFVELLRVVLGEPAVRRHRRRRVEQGPANRGRSEARSDLRQRRARAGGAVLADPVAAQTARRRGDRFAGLVLRRDLQSDLRRRA